VGQIFLAWRRHEVITWILWGIALWIAFYVVATLLFLGGDACGFASECLEGSGALIDRGDRAITAMLPFGLSIVGLVFLYVFMAQLIHTKQYVISHAVPKILTFVMASYATLGLLYFGFVSLSNWFGAFWGLATFFIVFGLSPLIVALWGKRHALVAFAAMSPCYLMFFWGAGFLEGYLDTPTRGLILGALAVLLTGIGIWYAAWYRFRYCWSPVNEDLLFMKSGWAPILRMRLMRHGREGWFSRWGDRERERRVERICKTPPKTFREQVRFFRIFSRPSRTGVAMFLGVLFFSPYFLLCNDDFLAFLTGLLVIGFSGIGMMSGAMIFEWRSVFADESLLPMSRKRYVLAAGLGRFQNLLLFLVPFTIFVVLVMIVQSSLWYTPEDLVIAIFIAGMLATMIPSLFLMAVYLPIWGIIAVIVFLELFFVYRGMPNHQFYILDLTIFMTLGAVLTPFGIWRLCRIEPGRIMRR
jgi:hypothetical protein